MMLSMEEDEETSQNKPEQRRKRRPRSRPSVPQKRNTPFTALPNEDGDYSPPGPNHSNPSRQPFNQSSKSPGSPFHSPEKRRGSPFLPGEIPKDENNNEDDDEDPRISHPAASKPRSASSSNQPNHKTSKNNTPQPPPRSNPTPTSKAYTTARTHLFTQKVASDGRPILFTNKALQDLLRELENAAKSDDEWMFGQIWEEIDGCLVKEGVEGLPAR